MAPPLPSANNGHVVPQAVLSAADRKPTRGGSLMLGCQIAMPNLERAAMKMFEKARKRNEILEGFPNTVKHMGPFPVNTIHNYTATWAKSPEITVKKRPKKV